MKRKAVAAEQAYELAPLHVLRVHPRNARQGDVGAIHESIQQNGFFGACVAQRSTGHILAGNHRFMAAREAGLAEIPVIWVDVDDDRALRILLADNRTNDIASYDQSALAAVLSELARSSDLLGTGYDGDDLDDLIKDLSGNSGGSGEGKKGPGDPGALPSQWAVYVECVDERSQVELLERLTEEGLNCRALTS